MISCTHAWFVPFSTTIKACHIEQNEFKPNYIPVLLPSSEFGNATQLHLVCLITLQFLSSSREPCDWGDFEIWGCEKKSSFAFSFFAQLLYIIKKYAPQFRHFFSPFLCSIANSCFIAVSLQYEEIETFGSNDPHQYYKVKGIVWNSA